MTPTPPPSTAAPASDVVARKRVIFSSVWFTVPGALAVIGAAYALVPPLRDVEEPVARLMVATRWLVVAMLPYVSVCLFIAGARFLEGSHDPTAATESARLKIHCRVMQNTLEQLIWLAICVLAIAPLLAPAEARLIPIVCVFFFVVRFVYWWGYLQKGTLGRAPAVQLTFALNVHLLLLALALLGRSLVSGV